MRLVVIDARAQSYSVYEDAQMLAQYTCERLLTAEEIEALRVLEEMPGVA